jgi:hypothetical protein
MRFLVVCTALAACSTPGTGIGSGVVAFTEADTGHVAAIDVENGRQWPIDGSGAFGSLSISADRQHVAYVGADAFVRVADLDGTVTKLDPPTGVTAMFGCSPGPTWGPNNSLAYCIADEYMSYGFMPAPGQPARKLLATDLAISADASTIVYHRRDSDPTQLGDVVAENADGSGQRVLAASSLETEFEFAPDGRHVVAVAEHPDAFRVVVHSLADGAMTDLGPGNLPLAMPGGSTFSSDGSEVIAVIGNELVAVQMTTGAKRHFATVDSNATVAQAAFVDADHVIYQRMETTQIPPGSDIESTSTSLRIASASTEVIAMPDTEGDCFVTGIAIGAGVAAVECDSAAIVSFDGTFRASTNARLALGIADDGSGIITLADDGTVAFVKTNGRVLPIAKALPRSQINGLLLGPLAAYAP